MGDDAVGKYNYGGLLNCQPGDLMRYVSDAEEAAGKGIGDED